MRIAIPVDEPSNLISEVFSDAPHFAIYDVHDETRAVAYQGRQRVENPCCGTTATFLREHGVEVVIAQGISENAVNQLLAAGVLAIKDVQPLSPDALIAHLVSGTLAATPPEAAVHGGGRGSGGCSSCCGGHKHEHEHQHEKGESLTSECNSTGACGSCTTSEVKAEPSRQ